MRPVDKAIWYIENHYREPVSLERLAVIAGVSRYHLSRSFCYAVGEPVSRYLRLRRLSKAALALADGEPDILDLALSLGYGSHEAFSRAFKEHFGQTPEQIRQQGNTDNLKLKDAMLMSETKLNTLEEPSITGAEALAIAGISRNYTFAGSAEVPDQWQTFAPMIATIPESRPSITYGVIYNSSDDGFDYLSGVAVPLNARLPSNLVRLELAAQTYAVFQHRGHVAGIRETCNTIWSDYLPASGLDVVEAPWFERYPESFDPLTGNGGLEIWIPVEA